MLNEILCVLAWVALSVLGQEHAVGVICPTTRTRASNVVRTEPLRQFIGSERGADITDKSAHEVQCGTDWPR